MSLIALGIEVQMREDARRALWWHQRPDGTWEQRRCLEWDDDPKPPVDLAPKTPPRHG